MRIKRIEVQSFGKLKNYTLDLAPGFQILLGNNEDGKTTVMTFLKMMFYKKLTGSSTSRTQYIPWDASPMRGGIEFESGGIPYRLQKVFGAIPSQDRIELLNMNNGADIALGRNVEVGQHFFSLDLAGFERSCFIGETGPISGTDTLTTRLIENLVQSGDEGSSKMEALGHLQKAAWELVSKSKKAGLLTDAQNHLRELELEQAELRHFLTRQQAFRQEYELLTRQYSALKNQEKSARLQKLEELLSIQESIAAEQVQLERPGLSIDALPRYLAEGERLSGEYHEARASLERAGSSDKAALEDGQVSIPISAEEMQAVLDQLAASTQADRILKEFSGTLTQAATDCDEAAAAHDKKVAEELSLRKALDTQFPGWENPSANTEKERLSDQLEQLRDGYDQKRTVWERQKAEAREQHEAAERHLRDLGPAKPKPSAALPVAAILITAGVLAGAFLLKMPLVLAGLVLPLLLLLVYLRGRKDPRKEEREAAQQALEQLALAEETLSRSIGAQSLEDEKKIEETKQQLLSLKKSEEASALPALKAQHDQARQASQVSEQFLQAALGRYQQRRADFLADWEDAPPIPQIPDAAQLAAIGEGLRTQAGRLGQMLGALLAAKDCNSVKEYQERYHALQSNAKNVALLTGLIEEEKSSARIFCEYVSLYEAVASVQEALETLQKLRVSWEAFEIKRRGLADKASGMGVSGQSAAEWQDECKRLRASMGGQELSEDAFPEPMKSAEELEERIRELSVTLRMPDRSLEQIGEEITEEQARIAEMEQYYNALLCAIEGMEEAAEELRNSFGPKLCEKAGGYLSALTGEYDSLIVSNDFAVKVKSAAGFKEHSYLSSGTVDQVYLSLRLAISKLIAPPGDPFPIFLDDILMQYDDFRAQRGLSFLQQIGEEDEGTQVVLFTCHQHIAEKAAQFGVPTKALLDA